MGVLPQPLSAVADFALERAVGLWLQGCHVLRGGEYRLERLVCALALEDRPNNPARIKLAAAIGTTTFVNDMSQEHRDVLTNDLNWFFSYFTPALFKSVLKLMKAGEYENAGAFYRRLALPLVYPVAPGDPPQAEAAPVLPPQSLTASAAVSDGPVASASPMDVDRAAPPLRQKRKADGAPDSEEAAKILRGFSDFRRAGLDELYHTLPGQQGVSMPGSLSSAAPAQSFQGPSAASAVPFSAATSVQATAAPFISQPALMRPMLPAERTEMPTVLRFWCDTMRYLHQIPDSARLDYLRPFVDGLLVSFDMAHPFDMAQRCDLFLINQITLLRVMTVAERDSFIQLFMDRLHAFESSSRGPAS